MTADFGAMVAVAVVAFLLFEGFLVGIRGQLAWHGQDDVLWLGVLMAAGLVGLAWGTLRRWVRRERRFLLLEELTAAHAVRPPVRPTPAETPGPTERPTAAAAAGRPT
jgi:hypothetical protein